MLDDIPMLDETNMHLGRHLLAEFYDCNPNVLNNPSLVEQHMKDAALACGATIVQSCFHRFNPYGVSGVVVIAESHLAIHTWPELGYASVDLYTCGDECDPLVAFDHLQATLMAGQASYVALKRGMVNANQQLLKAPPVVVTQPDAFNPTSAKVSATTTPAPVVKGQPAVAATAALSSGSVSSSSSSSSVAS